MDHRTTAVTNGPPREAKFQDRPGETAVTRRAELAVLDFTRQRPQVRNLSRPRGRNTRIRSPTARQAGGALFASQLAMFRRCSVAVGTAHPQWLGDALRRHMYVQLQATLRGLQATFSVLALLDRRFGHANFVRKCASARVWRLDRLALAPRARPSTPVRTRFEAVEPWQPASSPSSWSSCCCSASG